MVIFLIYFFERWQNFKTKKMNYLQTLIRSTAITPNGFGLGEGGLVGCSIFAECFCPLLPNPCYKLAAVN